MERASCLKKALEKNSQGFGPYQNKPFRGLHHNKEEAPTGNAPMGAIPLKAVTNHFPLAGENQTSEAPGVVFDPTIGDEGMETPPPNDSSKASLSPPVGGHLRSFSRDWQINKCSSNMLNIITNGYVLPFLSKPNLVRFPLIVSEHKAQPKDQALADCIQSLLSKNAIKRVENVKSLGFYSRLFLVPKPHQRWRPVIDLSWFNTFLQLEKFKMETFDSRGMGIVNRSIRCLPSHPHTSTLKEIPKILPQVSGVTAHIPPLWAGHGPPGFYNDCKRSEANGPLQRSQTSPIPGRLADQVPVLGGSPTEHSGSGRSNPVLGVDHKSGKVRTETYSGVFVCGLRIPSQFSPCKTLSREMAQTAGFDPTTQVQHVLTARCLMSLIGLIPSMEKMVPEGCLHMRPFQFHLKEHWRYPQSLDNLLPWTK